jgi:hypothetical protein
MLAAELSRSCQPDKTHHSHIEHRSFCLFSFALIMMLGDQFDIGGEDESIANSC